MSSAREKARCIDSYLGSVPTVIPLLEGSESNMLQTES